MSDGSAHGTEVEALLGEFTKIMTAAARRIHEEHRRRAAGWTAAASLLGIAGFPLAGRRRAGPVLAVAAGLVGALTQAGRHRRLAELSRPD